jgi:pimeloyl-ACP methyl ester carboxylesterase
MLGSDLYLSQFHFWLGRIGYRPFRSGISMNADCPNLLIQQRLRAAIVKAHKATRKKVHVIGHSLGGTIARAIATQMPELVASVIMLGAPIRSVAAHAAVLRVAEMVRQDILKRHGRKVLPTCYTAKCTCNFIESLMGEFPRSVRQTAVYSKYDGIMDWRICRTGDDDIDVEVSSTHLGMVFSPLVYQVVAERLAGDEVHTPPHRRVRPKA